MGYSPRGRKELDTTERLLVLVQVYVLKPTSPDSLRLVCTKEKKDKSKLTRDSYASSLGS